MLRFLAIAIIFYSAASGKLPTTEVLGMAPETVAAVLVALLLAPTIRRMME
ncbi:hypothetical protein [Thiohalomonas denitrificans]|uniref:Uncharacterized protein n=1 Tax=Thiohalomonas denitrificans TaxID=415747 RepID=A0A1G5Q237_9GAMM|nr:hypothetical protein [Thiohalomonas denitrificans]SCZ55722.1 hypothetical protein SAMN03097708_01185 [Thiohalomonas denitrificans]